MAADVDLTAGPPATGSLLSSLFGPAAAPLCRAVDASPEGVTLTLLYQGELADSSQVFVVRDARGRALGVVQLSSASAPGMVSRGIARARAAVACLGPTLGSTVLLPLVEGEIEGRSYAVMPYCLQFSEDRWRRPFERMALRPLVLDWVRAVAATTLASVPDAEVERRFRRPLERLGALAGAGEALVARIEQALSRLASGAWVPRHVLMHADLWHGNLLLQPVSRARAAGGRPGRWSRRLVIIDWAGAQPRGCAFFDLVRAAESLGVSSHCLRAEATRHCAIVGCEPVDAAGYVLVAIGVILAESENFPSHRLLAMAASSLDRLDAAFRSR